MDYEKTVNAIADFFEGEYFCIGRTVGKESVKGDPEHECADFEHFDEVYVDQVAGGLSGDDSHGTVYFHIGEGRYATAEY